MFDISTAKFSKKYNASKFKFKVGIVDLTASTKYNDFRLN